MSGFRGIVEYVRRQSVVVVAPLPQVNPYDQAKLQGYVPTYWVSLGLLPAKLDKVNVSPVSGRTVGYYSIVCRNPHTGIRERYSWRYSVSGGRCVEEKAFPVQYG